MPGEKRPDERGIRQPGSGCVGNGRRRGPSPARRWGGPIGVLPLLLCVGCFKASLATSTGPRVRGSWSVADEQYACVGEEVQFDLVLSKPFGKRPIDPMGIADYCTLEIDEVRLTAAPDFDGHFRFSHRLDDVTPGTIVRVTGTARRTFGRPDRMTYGGSPPEGTRSTDEADRKIASDSIRLIVYQPKVVFEIEKPEQPLDFSSGRVEIRKSDGTSISVYEDQPHRHGFTTTGPTDGRYYVMYLPQAEELNPVGTTEAEFTIYDQADERHSASAVIDTP